MLRTNLIFSSLHTVGEIFLSTKLECGKIWKNRGLEIFPFLIRNWETFFYLKLFIQEVCEAIINL